jgi:multidrug efflux system membrane fusion protein
VQKLKDSGAVSQEELDERKSTVAQAEANVAGAEAALESASAQSEFHPRHQPHRRPGQPRRSDARQSGDRRHQRRHIADLRGVHGSDVPVFRRDEQSYLRYTQMARAGERPELARCANPVQVGLANEEGFPHRATMDFVDNQLNSQTGTIARARCSRTRTACTRPGLFARVQLLGSSEYKAILIDDRAVNTDQSQKYVLLLGADNTVEYRKVKLGRIIDGLRIVREGLKPGDVIVVNGAQRVHPGITVTPQRVTMGATIRRRRRPRRPK